MFERPVTRTLAANTGTNADEYAKALVSAVAERAGGAVKVARVSREWFTDPLARLHPVARAVGCQLYETRAVHLRAVRRGQRVDIGRCELGGVGLSFDFWFPHSGIAVDQPGGRTVTDAELAHKAQWCATKSIIYVGPDNYDLEALSVVADERRRATQEACDA